MSRRERRAAALQRCQLPSGVGMNVRVELVAREGTPEAARKRGKAAWNRSQPHILRHLSKRHFQRHINESSNVKGPSGGEWRIGQPFRDGIFECTLVKATAPASSRNR